MAKVDLRHFDYQKVAKLDADMWESYYYSNRNALGLFIRAFRLINKEVGFSWYTTLKLAYYVGWAAAAYRLRKGNENYVRSEKYLTKLFRTVSENSLVPFDFKEVSKLELEWWDIQRYPNEHSKTLEQSLAENMATLFRKDVSKLKSYGHNRALALSLIDRRGENPLPPLDKKEMSRLLVKSWQSLHSAVQK